MAIILIRLRLCLIGVGIFMSFNDKCDNDNGPDSKNVTFNLFVEYNGIYYSSFVNKNWL